MNIADHVRLAADRSPDAAAILFEGRAVTYRQLDTDSTRLAAALVRLGARPGDRVALFLPNIPEFATTYLAAQKFGGVAVSANALLKTDELSYVLRDSGATVLFTTAELFPVIAPLTGAAGGPRYVVSCEETLAGRPTLAGLLARGGTEFRALSMGPSAPAAILYTSGTSGRPKGATLTHGNVVSNSRATNHCVGSGPGDRHLLFLPLTHCFGQNFIMNAAFASAGAVVLQRRFDEATTPALVRDCAVTHFYGVPAVYISLLNAGATPEDLAPARYYFSAAAPMPLDVARRWQQRFHRVIHEGYGATEVSPLATYNHDPARRPGSVGTPVPGVEVRVTDAQGRGLPPGTPGEVCVRGPNVMAGYWGRPEEAARALRGGWFHTGDVGYSDEDNYLYIVDRLTDVINSAGYKVWPREVEEVLYRHAAVRECAVTGEADPVKGEVVVAHVALRPGASAAAEDLMDHCRDLLAAYKVPRRVSLVADLPKNASGKMLKRLLWAGAAEESAPSCQDPCSR
jgi:long-chain acyl-CoA synthetase